ncbi:tetratricopeptide repeat protein [Trichloromonas sp.]|uniref:tetratricopeptide repeat protein n=1 Tax=Trichloromonas sp. TaxID=3069249 RepID=UPI003D815C29
MGKQRLVWVGGTVIILILLVIGVGLYLKARYCWDCTASERYARGTELLCDRDADGRARGAAFIRKAAAEGQPEAQALAGELYLQPRPGRYASIHRDLFECDAPGVPADRERALGYFNALARGGQVSAEMEFNLGVLIEEGILDPPLPNKRADDYFRHAAEQGEPRAMYEVGMAEDRQKNYAEAARWFRESFSRAGHPGAALMLGDYAFYGRLGAVDLGKALPWYQKALDAAQNPEVAGIGAAFALRAQQRLNIAGGYQQRTGGKAAVPVSYRLGGGPSEYRVYAADSQSLLGRVVRDGGLVVASFLGGKDGEAAAGREVASMNDGLNWILESYALGRYGAGKTFRFVLAAE